MGQLTVTYPFTSTEAIRGALGVDATDLSDSRITEAELDVELVLDLSQWITNWELKLSPVDPVSPEQKRLQLALQTYCKWFCALEYLQRPLSFAQLNGDGKAEIRRFTNFDWEQLIASATLKVATYRGLVASLDPDAPADEEVTATFVLASATSPDYDPVTNEGGVA